MLWGQFLEREINTDNALISQNKRTNEMFEKDVTLVLFDILGHFYEFWKFFFDSGACNTFYF